mgnify:CR=1 FL=1|tara:strand:- start:84768 stop:85124 length:357 start_codon:yes stop_codon:yes gene_type:complete
MRAAPASVSRPVEDAPKPNTSHQADRQVPQQAPRQAPTIKPVKPIKSAPREEKSEPKIQVVKSDSNPTSAPVSAPPERTQPTPQMRAPTPEEVAADPLVKSVLDVFEGEIKRVHPKNH